MAGGLGRAQGGYDEMVFRAMVRDDAHFYDPLGLVVGRHQGRLPGRRQRLPLRHALHHLPRADLFAREGDRMGRRGRTAAALLRRPVSGGLRQAARRGLGANGSRGSTSSSSQSRSDPRSTRSTPHTRPVARAALGSVSRAYYDPSAAASSIAAFRYPGRGRRTSARSRSTTAASSTLADIKGPCSTAVTSLAYDPGTRDAVLHHRQQRLPRPHGARPAHGTDAHAAEGRAHRRPRLQPADRSLWGIRHLNGIVHPGAHAATRTPTGTQVHVVPVRRVPYDLDISPDGTLLSAPFGEINGDQAVRSSPSTSSLAGDATPVAQLRLRHRRPGRLRVLAGRPVLYGSSYYTGVSNIYRYEIATGEDRGADQRRDRLLPPAAAAGRAPARLRLYRARASCRRVIDAQAARGPGRDHVPRRADRRAASGRQALERRLAGDDRSETRSPSARARTDPRRDALESLYPIVEGYKDSVAVGMHGNCSRSARARPHRRRHRATARTTRCQQYERVHFDALLGTLRWRSATSTTARDFYDLFGPTKTSRGATSLRRLQDAR